MALIRCVNCNSVMPSTLLACPRCGKLVGSDSKHRKRIIVELGVLLILAIPLAYLAGPFVAMPITVIVAIVLWNKPSK